VAGWQEAERSRKLSNYLGTRRERTNVLLLRWYVEFFCGLDGKKGVGKNPFPVSYR
jgi:hypothetical protein